VIRKNSMSARRRPEILAVWATENGVSMHDHGIVQAGVRTDQSLGVQLAHTRQHARCRSERYRHDLEPWRIRACDTVRCREGGNPPRWIAGAPAAVALKVWLGAGAYLLAEPV
jgi:hypothetical protein